MKEVDLVALKLLEIFEREQLLEPPVKSEFFVLIGLAWNIGGVWRSLPRTFSVGFMAWQLTRWWAMHGASAQS